MKKKILINASVITQKPTGVGIYNIELLKRLLPKLDQHDIEYVIYCYNPKLILQFTDRDKIRKISLGTLFDKMFLRFLSVHRIFWNLFLLNKAAANYHIVYALSTYGSLKNHKQIITVHDLIALQFPKQHKLQYLYFKYIVPFILSNCFKIIAISDFTAKEITKHYLKIKGEKIVLIKNGIDHITDLSNPASNNLVDKITDQKPFCLMVGASYYHKNAETLLELARILQPSNIKFVVVGSPSRYYKSLIKEAVRRQLTNIFFPGYVDEATLSALYKKATLHIYISLYEGFGFPPAEAAFYGTRSIISDHPALSEIYTTYFPVVNPKNATVIASLIKQNYSSVSKDYSIYHSLKLLYNWERTSTEIMDLLSNGLDIINDRHS